MIRYSKYLLVWGLVLVVAGGITTSFAADTTTLRLDSGRITAQATERGSRLDIDVTSSVSGPLACQFRVGNTTLSGLSCSRSIRASSSQEVSIYIQLQSSQGTLRYDTRRRRFVAGIDAGSQTQQPSPSQTYRLNLRTSTYATRVERFVDLSLYSYRNNNLYSSTDRIEFEVFKKSGSRYIQASSRDYTIRSHSYRMQLSDRGVAHLRNYLKFHRTGEYEIRARNTTRTTSSTTRISVSSSSDTGQEPSTTTHNYYTLELSPALPELRDMIDLSIRSFDTNNEVLSSRDTLDIEIQRRLLPDSHIWRTLKTSNVCHLRQSSYRFTYSDAGRADLSNLVSCTSKGFYRIKITNRNNSSMTRYVYFTIVDERDFSSRALAGFTRTQKRSIQDEYKGFMNQVNGRENLYPNLSSSIRRYNLWTNYYRELNKITYSKADTLVNYRAYQSLRDDFYDKLRLWR